MQIDRAFFLGSKDLALQGTHRSLIALALLVLMCAGAATVGVARDSNPGAFWLVATVVVGSALTLVGISSTLGWGSLGTAVVVTTSVFHLGLVPALWFGLDDAYGFAQYTLTWIDESAAQEAVVFTVRALSAFALGYWAAHVIAHSIQYRRKLTRAGVTTAVEAAPAFLAIWGSALAATGAVLIVVNYSLLQGYTTYLTQSNFEGGSWGPFALMTGWAITIAARQRLALVATTSVALIVFTLMALSGARTFLFTALAVVVVVGIKTRGRYLRGWLLIVLPILLSAASFMRALRDGKGAISALAAPLNALYEFGSSARPLIEMVKLEQSGDFTRTTTFTNSLIVWPTNKVRAYLGEPVRESDFGYGVQLLQDSFGEEYRFGFSNLAELFTNYDPWTGLLVMGVFGAAIFLVDFSLPGTRIGALITLIIAVPTLYSIRQPVTLFIPHGAFTLAAGLTGALGAYVIGRKQLHSRRPQA